MLTHDALNTYVADRQQARVEAAATARTGRLLRRARAALAQGPSGSADVAPVPTPTSSAAAGGSGDPAVAVLRTAAPAGAPEAA